MLNPLHGRIAHLGRSSKPSNVWASPPGASRTIGGERLTGGVSSDIWRIDLPSGTDLRETALAKLRVAADWHAPVERNVYEARWMRHAIGFAPQLLGQDDVSGTLAMAYLPPDKHPLWKEPASGWDRRSGFAAQVAEALVTIHASSAADPGIASEFPTDTIFYEIRLEPYLVATARVHPIWLTGCSLWWT